MNVLDRLILTIYSLGLTILSIVLLAISMRIIPYEQTVRYMNTFYEAGDMRIAHMVASAILLLISLKFLFQSVKRGGREKTSASITQHTDAGHVHISIDTLESVALRASRRIRGVKEVKAIIRTEDIGTSIILKVGIDGEVPVPQIVQELQQAVKTQVEHIIGTDVRDVDVKITGVVQPSPSRVSRVE